MFSARFGALLKSARQHLNMTREALALRGGVSTRLVAELERGERPNVSLESALKLLNVVGVTVSATAPNGASAEVHDASAAARARAARAAQRRQTRTGQHMHLHDEGADPAPGRSKVKRVAALTQISRLAHRVSSLSTRGRSIR